jgi:glycerate 2-kinase
MTSESQEAKRALLHREARQIFARALQASNIPAAFDSHLRFEARRLIRHSAASGNSIVFSLDDYQKIYVIALGKAALAMLDTLLERLPGDLSLEGVCSAPGLPGLRHPKIQYYAGGHPLPNENSFRSAHAALRLLEQAGRHTIVFFLISGGGSALFDAPLDKTISLEDTVTFHEILVGAGATIREMNTVRKHFSAVKGGRLAVAAPEAAKLSLLVADVPLSQLDALASAPTLPDSSTVEECREILARYRLLEQFPASVRAFFTNPDLPETPGNKRIPHPTPGGRTSKVEERETVKRDEEIFAPPEEIDRVFAYAQPPGFAHSEIDLLLSNRDLVRAATEDARALGFEVFIDNTCDDWDYRDAAQYLLTRFHQLRREYQRPCLLSGGEVTVRLERKAGAGGRNQQFALACALELAGGRLIEHSPGSRPLATEPGATAPDSPTPDSPIVVLSAGSDGVDGNSPAAGAIADSTTVSRAQSCGLDAAGSLNGFDSYPVFSALGDSVVTGPTNNNLRDLRIFLSR